MNASELNARNLKVLPSRPAAVPPEVDLHSTSAFPPRLRENPRGSGFDRSPVAEGSSPFDGSLRPDEPPDAGAARPAPGAPSAAEARPAAGAPAATGACAREGRAILSSQLPRMRQRSDRGMSQGGGAAVRLGRYLSITVVAVVDVGRDLSPARYAGRLTSKSPGWCSLSMRDASPQCCLHFCRCAGVPPPEIASFGGRHTRAHTNKGSIAAKHRA